MEESSTPDPKPLSHCEECGNNPWKYRCPGCSIRTCSLPCVKSHKQRTNCTGQKDRSEIVPLSRFDDNLLLSDYNFLEEAKRVAEVARRVRHGIGSNYYSKLPFGLQMLRNAAHRRRMRLLILPYGMTKRHKNKSRYDKRNNSIMWTIEWRFHSTNVVLMDHRVNECLNIRSMLEKHLKPRPWSHPLKSFCDEHVENLKYFIQKNPKGSKSAFRELNPSVPIGNQMSDIVIVEYPVIFVYLPSHKYNFEVEKNAIAFYTSEKFTEKMDSMPSPVGIVFKEEEIEDDGSYDTQVLDLMHQGGTEVCHGVQNSDRVAVVDKVSFASDTMMFETAMESSNLISSCKVQDQEMGTNINEKATSSLICNFEFEQDLKDAYCDLVGGINPDDFLCLDGLYSDGDEREDNVDACMGFGESLEGELEEGEIPSY